MNPTPVFSDAKDLLRDLRRALHRIPEPAHAEHRTQRFILENLQGTGADSVECVGTGVKAVYRAPRPSGTLCFRADMDALRVTEENEVPYASQSPGLMHACGHDGHMAVLLAFAALLRSHRDRMVNDIVLLFQPAEESVGGAKGMVEAGVLRDPDVDSVFGLHLMPHIPQGRIGLRPGALMAAASEFDITVTGRSAHAAMPHEGVDALLAAAHLVVQMQGIVSRDTDPFEACVVSIGKVSGGEARNIVARKVVLQGTLRSYSKAVFLRTKERIAALMAGLEKGMGVYADFRETMYYPPVVNDERLAKKAALLLGDMAFEPAPLMTAEDFAYYQREVPGLFLFLGCRNEDKGHVHALHTPRFDFDEAALAAGLEAFWRIAFCAGMV
ncbi:MAG: amidohydrolase [Clostridiales bacterium]|jgi:amidohydrolase|nr:amidohydrolase [Clostridiales bacterium]